MPSVEAGLDWIACRKAQASPDSVQDAIVQSHADLRAVIKQHHEELKQLLNDWMSKLEVVEKEQEVAAEQAADPTDHSGESLLLREAGVVIGQSERPLPPGLVVYNPEPPRSGKAQDGEPQERPSLQSELTKEWQLTGSHGLAATRRGSSRFLTEKPKRSSHRRRSAEQCLFVHSKVQLVKSQSLLRRITSNRAFEWVSILLILLNAVSVGLQVSSTAEKVATDVATGRESDGKLPARFFATQILFCMLFSAELALRWTADGLKDFFQTADAAWNVFDVIIVSISVMETILDHVAEGSVLASISLLRVFRIVRIVRVVRVIRVMPAFHELRLMIDSILGSITSFLWCMMVFCVLFYMFGLTLTAAVSTHLSNVGNRVATTPELQRHFGSLGNCIVSLFMAMSGGRDWAEFYDAMDGMSPIPRFLFLVYVAFALFAVTNVVLAVFVESAIRTSGKDRETIIREELGAQTRYTREMEEVFEEMDYDGTGTITMDEFEQHLDDPRVIAYFNTLKLDVSDARMLFLLLDADHSGSIDIEEFLEGCQRLKGESRNLDIAIIRFELEWLRHTLAALTTTMEARRSPSRRGASKERSAGKEAST